jgi:hypothetical protein
MLNVANALQAFLGLPFGHLAICCGQLHALLCVTQSTLRHRALERLNFLHRPKLHRFVRRDLP